MYYNQRLREYRKDNKELTQEEFAKRIGLKREQYRRYENALNEMKAGHIIKICKEFNISADYILGLIDEPIPLNQCKKCKCKEVR